jgi:hypothetical protein
MYVLDMLRRRTSQERVVNKLKPIIAEVFRLARAREAVLVRTRLVINDSRLLDGFWLKTLPKE